MLTLAYLSRFPAGIRRGMRYHCLNSNGGRGCYLFLWITVFFCGGILNNGLIEGVRSKLFFICWVVFAILVLLAFAGYHTFLGVLGFMIIIGIAVLETTRLWESL